MFNISQQHPLSKTVTDSKIVYCLVFFFLFFSFILWFKKKILYFLFFIYIFFPFILWFCCWFFPRFWIINFFLFFFFLFFSDFWGLVFCMFCFVLFGWFLLPPPHHPTNPPFFLFQRVFLCFLGRGGGGRLFCFFNLGYMQTYDSTFISPPSRFFLVYCLVCLLLLFILSFIVCLFAFLFYFYF